MVEFSFGLIEGSFVQLKGQKPVRSVAEDFVSNKQISRANKEFIKNDEGTDIIKLSSQYFSTGNNENITWWRRHPYSCM